MDLKLARRHIGRGDRAFGPIRRLESLRHIGYGGSTGTAE